MGNAEKKVNTRMMKQKHNKLVRDRIPDSIRAQGRDCGTRKLDDKEYNELLREKLVEEANEVVEACSKEELIDELADVLQIVRSIVDFEGIDYKIVEKHMKKKRKDRGSFESKVFLEWSEVAKPNP